MNKLFLDTITKGDTILYWDSKTKTHKKATYISHRSIDYGRYCFRIIKEDGIWSQYTTSRWLPDPTMPKPLNK